MTEFDALPNGAHAGVVLRHDDTMPAYRVASAPVAMVGAYPSRDAFAGREALDAWDGSPIGDRHLPPLHRDAYTISPAGLRV